MKTSARLVVAAMLVLGLGGLTANTAAAAGGSFRCTGTTGTVRFSPGLLLSTGLPQAISLTARGLSCSGGFVTAGRLSATFRSPDVRCSGFVGPVNRGYATAVWTAPAGMGSTTMKLNLTITHSSGHTMSGTLSGVVTTSGSNLASGKAVSGTIALNKGLGAVASGGDCTVVLPLTQAGITSISLRTG